MDESETMRLHFWNIVQKDSLSYIPVLIKNIFKLQNLDNYHAIKYASHDTIISDLENFVKTEVYASHIPTGSNLTDYYGLFSRNPKDFQFTLGEKSLILYIITFINDTAFDEWKKNLGCIASIESLPKKPRLSLDKLCDIQFGNDTPTEASFLQMIVKTFNTNYDAKPNRFRYEYSLKLFASYIRMVGGPILYETLSANLPLPSISAINKFINTSADKIIEGQCRIKELTKFLEDRNLPKIVCLSEDATRINGRIQYDSINDQIIGFVLPIDANSMPTSFFFKASSIKKIYEYFENGKISTLLYTYMIQPLQTNCLSFCLNLFGTDNSFTAEDSIKRWKFITELLKKEGISILGFSSDGDPRLLKAIRIQTQIGKAESAM